MTWVFPSCYLFTRERAILPRSKPMSTIHFWLRFSIHSHINAGVLLDDVKN